MRGQFSDSEKTKSLFLETGGSRKAGTEASENQAYPRRHCTVEDDSGGMLNGAGMPQTPFGACFKGYDG